METEHKHHYDLSKSRRTRKPLKLEEKTDQWSSSVSPEEVLQQIYDGKAEAEIEEAKPADGHEKDEEIMKQVMVDEQMNAKAGKRNPLGYYLKEEDEEKENLQLVTKQQGEGMKEVKLGGMVNHYVKVLSHLFKLRKDCSRLGSGNRKKPLVKLTMP